MKSVCRLTRSHRRRRIGVQPISSCIAGHCLRSMKQENRNGQTGDDTSALSSVTADSLLFEVRCNNEIGLSFNPQPSAQANRRSADFFVHRGALFEIDETRESQRPKGR